MYYVEWIVKYLDAVEAPSILGMEKETPMLTDDSLIEVVIEQNDMEYV
jgi:hypothetical protein